MKKGAGLAVVSMVASLLGCGEDVGQGPWVPGPGTTGAPAAAAGTTATPSGSTTGETTAAPPGGASDAGFVPNGSTGPAVDTTSTGAGTGEAGVMEVVPDAGQLDAMEAGPAVPVEAGVEAGQLEIPEPVDSPMVWGVGIGVTDLEAAVDFYTDVMKTTVEQQGVKREDRTEAVLYASQAMRGSRLVLMKFDDGRETRKITTKLVWQSSDAGGVNRAASSHPDYVSRLNFGIVQFDGPETYIQEVGGVFDSGGSGIEVPYIVAMGFSVSDLAASREFYSTTLGMEDSRTGSFNVEDATGSGRITEYQERYASEGGGSALILQEWSPARNSKDNPVKVVLFVPDAQAFADKVVAGGGSIVAEAARTAVYDNRLLIVAKDPDGYVLELVQ